MGIAITPEARGGFLEPDDRIHDSTLTAKDHATALLQSAYSQQGPFTGVPKPQAVGSMVLRGSGTPSQDAHVEVVAKRAGNPGLGRGGQIWRDVAAGDTTAQFKGWDGPQLVTGWDALLHTTSVSQVTTWQPDIIRLANGTLLAAYNYNTATNTAQIAVYTPSDSTWTLASLSIDWDVECGTLLQLPSGRILFFYSARSGDQVEMRYSDDDGVTWTVGGRAVLATPIGSTTMREMRARYSNGQILLLITHTASPSEDMAQYSSDDDGASFQARVTDWRTPTGEDPQMPSIVPIPAGGFLVVYHDGDAGTPKYKSRRIGSATEDLTSTTAVDIASGAGSSLIPGVTAFADEDGTIYAYVHTTGVNQDLTPYFSQDGGLTWATFANTAFFSGDEGGAYLHTYGAESLGGRIFLLTRWQGSSYGPFSVGVVELGGFSSHTGPAHVDATEYTDTDYVSFGADSATSLPAWQFLPLDIASNLSAAAWSTSGTGTETIIAAAQQQTVTTAGQTRIYTKTRGTSSAGTPSRDAVAIFYDGAIEVPTGSGDDSTTEIAAVFRFLDSDGAGASTYEHKVSLRFDEDGFSLYDELAGPTIVGSAVVVDLKARLLIRLSMDNGGNVRTWYARDAHVREWTAGPTGALTDGGAVVGLSEVSWGHITAAANTSRWGTFQVTSYAGRWDESSSTFIGTAWTNPDDLHARSFSTTPALIHDGMKLAATSGPAYIGDTWDMQADYKYPLRNLFPFSVPSPSEGWRSKDDSTTVSLVFDLDDLFTDSTLQGTTLGVFLREANIKAFSLEGWNGAAWVTIAAGDAAAGFTGLKYGRRGRIVSPDLGVAHAAENFIYREAHRGDTIDLGEGKLRRIQSNDSGAWTDEDTKHPVVRLNADDIDGTEATSGTAAIWRRNFGVVVHEVTTAYRYVKFKVSAHSTATGDFRIGSLYLGPVRMFGWPYDRGWSRRKLYNIDVQTRRDGARSAVKLGPARRTWDIAWANTTVRRPQILAASPKPDFIEGTTGGENIATRQATISDVVGTLDGSDGSQRPVVMLRTIPAESGDIDYTIDEFWLAGRILADPQIDHLVGSETTISAEKLNQITIEESV